METNLERREFEGARGAGTDTPQQSADGSDAVDGVASRAREAAGGVRGRAADGWNWVRSNPWPVLGALVGIGVLLAWQRRGDPARRLAHMDSDRPVGRGRSFRIGGTDEVAERMSEASS